MNIEKYKSDIIKIIYKYLPDAKIYLFGSRARLTNKSGSDFDIAIDSGKKIDVGIIVKIKEEIESTNIPVFVDLIDLNFVSESFIETIRKEWILWSK